MIILIPLMRKSSSSIIELRLLSSCYPLKAKPLLTIGCEIALVGLMPNNGQINRIYLMFDDHLDHFDENIE